MKKLSNKSMSEVQDGKVSKAEYCATAAMIMANNDISENIRALVGGYCA